MFAKMSFLILLLFTLPLLSFAQESSMFYLAPDYDFRKVPDSGGKPVTVRSQCNISYLTAKPSTLDHMDADDHDDQGQLEPEEHPGHRRSCSNYQLGRHHQVPVEGSQGETIKFMWRRVTCFSNLSQNCPKVVSKLSQSCLKEGPKLSQSYKQVTCFSR